MSSLLRCGFEAGSGFFDPQTTSLGFTTAYKSCHPNILASNVYSYTSGRRSQQASISIGQSSNLYLNTSGMARDLYGAGSSQPYSGLYASIFTKIEDGWENVTYFPSLYIYDSAGNSANFDIGDGAVIGNGWYFIQFGFRINAGTKQVKYRTQKVSDSVVVTLRDWTNLSSLPSPQTFTSNYIDVVLFSTPRPYYFDDVAFNNASGLVDNGFPQRLSCTGIRLNATGGAGTFLFFNASTFFESTSGIDTKYAYGSVTGDYYTNQYTGFNSSGYQNFQGFNMFMSGLQDFNGLSSNITGIQIGTVSGVSIEPTQNHFKTLPNIQNMFSISDVANVGLYNNFGNAIPDVSGFKFFIRNIGTA